jgi:hypothetical protein
MNHRSKPNEYIFIKIGPNEIKLSRSALRTVTMWIIWLAALILGSQFGRLAVLPPTPSGFILCVDARTG